MLGEPEMDHLLVVVASHLCDHLKAILRKRRHDQHSTTTKVDVDRLLATKWDMALKRLDWYDVREEWLEDVFGDSKITDDDRHEARAWCQKIQDGIDDFYRVPLQTLCRSQIRRKFQKLHWIVVAEECDPNSAG